MPDLPPAAPRACEWQPISSAPKQHDGLLLTDGTVVSQGGWISQLDQGAEYEGQAGAPSAGWWSVDGIEEPTHWMKLPQPPDPPACSAPAPEGAMSDKAFEVAPNVGDFVWVRFAQSRTSTEPPKWFKYQRQTNGNLHPIDSFDEPRFVVLPFDESCWFQVYGPPTLTFPDNVEIDKARELADAQARHLWLSHYGLARRFPAEQVNALIEQLFQREVSS